MCCICFYSPCMHNLQFLMLVHTSAAYISFGFSMMITPKFQKPVEESNTSIIALSASMYQTFR